MQEPILLQVISRPPPTGQAAISKTPEFIGQIGDFRHAGARGMRILATENMQNLI
jgi:hypothetical protein